MKRFMLFGFKFLTFHIWTYFKFILILDLIKN